MPSIESPAGAVHTSSEREPRIEPIHWPDIQARSASLAFFAVCASAPAAIAHTRTAIDTTRQVLLMASPLQARNVSHGPRRFAGHWPLTATDH